MIIHLGHLPDSDLSPNKRLHHMALYQAKLLAKEENDGDFNPVGASQLFTLNFTDNRAC